MRKKLVFIITLISLFAMCSSTLVYAKGAENTLYIAKINDNRNTEDVIVYKYRYNSTGNLQYRRWNKTKNRWEDSYWIDVN